ncbi:MAG: hypothetical protein L3J14_06180 [Flavobacteriaceae bacterium]|nr:hypothetical protein [Flavobacteriaceae bacterium]
MLDLIKNPIFVSLLTFFITALLSKYIIPYLPEAKVVSNKLKPIFGKLSVFIGQLFMLGGFLILPILGTLKYIEDKLTVEESYYRFTIIAVGYAVFFGLYLCFSIYITLRERIEKLEKQVDVIELTEELKKMKV